MRFHVGCYLSWVATGIAIGALGGSAWGQGEATFTIVKQAEPDECFNGVGQPYIPLNPGDECDIGHVPKANHDYAWGLASDGKNIWIGTGGNAAALANSLVGLVVGEGPEPDLYESDLGVPIRVWEFGASQYPDVPELLREFYGDWRPPRVFQYNAKTGECFERTPWNDPNLFRCVGLRSAGVHKGVALLCGQSFLSTGIYMFAFNAETGEYLGSSYQLPYSQIRRFIVAEGELYTGVLNTFGARSRGSVLKWTGSLRNPFSFQTVGDIDNDVAYLAYHKGRLFAGTWRSFSPLSIPFTDSLFPPPCGVWMSPPVGLLGLNRLDSGKWEKVWDPTFYEVEPGAVGGYSIGAMEGYGDALFFGTLHFPGLGALAFLETYGIQLDLEVSFEEVERRPIVVRAKGYGGKNPPTVELLYGNEVLRKYDPNTQTFSDAVNATGAEGIYGTSGFGNPFNFYVWSSVVHNGHLYFGTFDVSSVFLIDLIVDNMPAPPGIGTDLYAFLSDSSPAVPQNVNGCGNRAAHGGRNLVSLPKYGLFMGMANSANLLTDPFDNLPDGGFALHRMDQMAAPPLTQGATATQNLPVDRLAEFYKSKFSLLRRLGD